MQSIGVDVSSNFMGPKLTAYHEMTRQPRATISLTKASKLIDDKRTLTTAEESPEKSRKGRRKSAFATDEEGYMFVEEGFRIKFANAEVIDFYADSREAKDEWMAVLSEVIGREVGAEKTTWMSAVLARERALLAQGGSPPKANPLVIDKVPVREASKAPVPKYFQSEGSAGNARACAEDAASIDGSEACPSR